ncbi:MAG: hypothetical protein ACYCST_07905 [Acidimicrobiales bacterium]
MTSSTGQRKLEAKAKLRPWRHKEAALVDAYFAADAAADAFGAKEKMKANNAEYGPKGVVGGDARVTTAEASGQAITAVATAITGLAALSGNARTADLLGLDLWEIKRARATIKHYVP